jgi:hypothetical protein
MNYPKENKYCLTPYTDYSATMHESSPYSKSDTFEGAKFDKMIFSAKHELFVIHFSNI